MTMNVTIDINENGWTVKVTAISGTEYSETWKLTGPGRITRSEGNFNNVPQIDPEFVDVLAESSFSFANILDAIKKHT